MAYFEERESKTDPGKVRYYVRVFIAQDGATQRSMSKTFDTIEEARAWAATKELKRSRGTLSEPSRDTLAVYGRRWLTDTARSRVQSSTWAGYEEKFRNYIEKTPEGTAPVGKVRMRDLRPAHLRRLYTFMEFERGLSRETIRALHAVLRQVIRQAISERVIEEPDVWMLFKPPALPKVKIKTLTEEQLGRFLEAARKDRHYALWYVLATTGMRPGEALGLKWSNVNLDTGEVQIALSLSRVTGKPWELKAPKNDKERSVSLPKATVRVLRDHRKVQLEDRLKAGKVWEDNDLVFTTRKGRPADWTTLRGHFVRTMRRAGLGTYGPEPEKPKGKPGPNKQPKFTPLVHPYALRHTHATLSIWGGVPSKVVSERLGHATVAFTLDRYTDSPDGSQRVAADRWDTVLEGMDG